MADFPLLGYRLMIVDDDAMTLEVLTLLAGDAGFLVECYDSGHSALEAVAAARATFPQAILADLQMPGPSGETLAKLMRAACGQEAILLAMSGTAAVPELTRGYDAFLLKPFSIKQLVAALRDTVQGAVPAAANPAGQAALNEATFEALLHSMPREQVRKLYIMCLDDVELRVATLRQAAAARDDDAYRRAAHSIKGGCGMVGASELAGLADAIEAEGLPDVGERAPFEEFLAASSKLRRILDARLT